MSKVIVVGAGIIGLTSALALTERGHKVDVITADAPGDTTSAVAGALWGPWLVRPRHRVLDWAGRSLQTLNEQARIPDSGVRIARCLDVADQEYPPPDWAPLQPDRHALSANQVPNGYRHAISYSAPLVDMPIHLKYLMRRVEATGARVEIQRLQNLDDIDAPLVINCTGIGARDLVPDPDLYAVRGYHVVVSNPGLSTVIEADTGDSMDLIAIYPHDDHVVLGGTAEPNAWSRQPDPAVADAILARCARIEPTLLQAEVIEHRIGLRPTMPEIRLEAERGADRTIVHNYGHSGAGVSIAWGCAYEIADSLS